MGDQAAGTGTIPSPEIASPAISNCGPESRSSNSNIPNYLPWIMRSWSLCVFSIIPLGIIAATEYLLHISRQHTGLFSLDDNESKLVFRSFVTQFFGLITLVFIGLFFDDLDQTVKRMEPFYQLSKPQGAVGWDSLCIDYFRPLLYFTPIIAIRHQHWAVLCSSLGVIISTNVLTVLALGIFNNVGNDEAVMDLRYTRAFEAFLVSLSVLVAILAIIVRRRNSGLKDYPGGFGALIELASHKRPENSLYTYFDELGLDEVSEKELHKIVGPIRFQLKPGDFEDHSFDIVIYDGDVSPPWYRRAWDGLKALINVIRAWGRYFYKDNHPFLFQTIPLICTITVLLVLFVIANGQPFWSTKNLGFWMFLEEERFARSALCALINTVLWAQIDRNAKLMEPIYLLLKKDGAPLSVLRLDYLGAWPLQDLYYFFVSSKKTKNRPSDYVILMVILGTYASSFFSVGWNIQNMSNGFGPSFWASLGIMVLCELIMLAALVAIFIYWRRPVLPRQPITLASNLLFVYATNISLDEIDSDDRTDTSTTASSSYEETPRPSQDQSIRDSIEPIIECVTVPSLTQNPHKNPEVLAEHEDSVAPSRYIGTKGECSCSAKSHNSGEMNDTVPLASGHRPISSSDSFYNGSSTSSIVRVASNETISASHHELEELAEVTGSSSQLGLDQTQAANTRDSKKYAFGWFKSRDRKLHLGIGECKVVSSYSPDRGDLQHFEPA